MATFKDVSTFRRSKVWEYFKFSWGCLLLVVRVQADWLLFLNRDGHNKARGPTPALSNLLSGPSVNCKDNKKNYKHI